MPERIHPRSAVEPWELSPRGVRLAERADLGKIDLRGDAAARAFKAAIGRCLDLLLPSEPCTSATKGRVTALWLGPDEWLLTCPGGDVAFFTNTLREALAGGHAAVTDVSDARVAFRVAGPSARDLLAKGCPLDLHARAFAQGSCAQSRLAKASVLIHLVDDHPGFGPDFDVYVARSFAHYLWSWLDDAGREFGVQVGGA